MMTVRTYAKEDFVAVCQVYGEAKSDELRFEPRSFQVTPLHQDAALAAAFSESDVLVFDDGAVGGFAATFEHQLRALFVRRDRRGRGIGQALLRAVLDKAACDVTLHVAKSNARAIAFYENNGFLRGEEMVRKYDNAEIVYLKMRHRFQAVATDVTNTR